MLAMNITALAIFRRYGRFGPFHLAAIFSLATTLAGFIPAFTRRQRARWLALHYEFMAWSNVGLLAAAGAEATTRLPAAPWGAVAATSAAMFAAGAAVVVHNRSRFLKW